MTDMIKKPSRGRLPAFRLGVLIYSAALILLSAVLLLTLRGYLAAYERSQPKNAAQSYLDSLDYDRLTALFTALIDPDGVGNVSELIREKYVNPFLSSETACLKDLTVSSGETAFILTCGGKGAIRVHLSAIKGAAGFGLPGWTVDRAEVIPSFVETVPYAFAVPVGAVVSVNGRTQEAASITDEVPYPGLNPLDASETPRFSVYSVGGLYTEPEITVSLGGKILSETLTSGDLVYYTDQKLSLHTCYVTIPENAVLTVNGTLVDLSSIPSESYLYPVSVYESENSVPLELRKGRTVALSGFAADPVITATVDGVLLSMAAGDNVIVCSQPADLLHSVTITVPDGAIVTLNGHPLTNVTPEITELAEVSFKGIEKYTDFVPKTAVYSVPGLYNTPEILVTYNGAALSPVSSEDPATFAFPSLSAIPEEHKNAANDFIQAYLIYVSHGYPECDETIKTLLALMLYGTDAYTDIYRSYEAYYWIRNYKETRYCNVDFTDYTPYGDTLFSCSIPFEIETVRGSIPVYASGTMHAVFVRTYSGWKVGAFSLA